MALAVVINDSVFAVILGASFTSSIALMAWIVKTLAALNVRVEINEERIDRLEVARWGQLGSVKLKVLAVGLIFLVLVFWSGLYLKVQADSHRRSVACESRQNLYDGQIVYTTYLANEFRISEAEERAALKRLRKALGPRPVC